MDFSGRIGKVIFLAAPLLGALFGYRFMGWIGAVVYGIAAWPALCAVVFSYLIASLWVKYIRDRKRVSLLSTESLHNIVSNPKDHDFRFAFAQLKARGEDVESARQLLIEMLRSKDRHESGLGLARLQELYPKLRHAIAPKVEESPEEFNAWVTAIVENRV